MQVKIDKLPQSQLELEIEVPAEELSVFVEQACSNLGKDLEIKGFRKGKAPKEIIEEHFGSEKILIEAANLAVEENYKKAVFSLNIADAYPEEAKLRSYNRKLTLNRGKNIIIQDKYELIEAKKNLELSLITWREPEIVEEGRIRLKNPEQLEDAKELFIRYDWEEFKSVIEPITLEDGRLRSSWGEIIYRIKLTMRNTTLKGEFSIRIEK